MLKGIKLSSVKEYLRGTKEEWLQIGHSTKAPPKAGAWEERRVKSPGRGRGKDSDYFGSSSCWVETLLSIKQRKAYPFGIETPVISPKKPSVINPTLFTWILCSATSAHLTLCHLSADGLKYVLQRSPLFSAITYPDCLKFELLGFGEQFKLP